MFLFRESKRVREKEYERLEHVYQMREIIVQKSSFDENSCTVTRCKKKNKLVRKY